MHELDRNKLALVKDRVGARDWSPELRRTPRGGMELSQLMALQNLQNVLLSDQKDRWAWTIDGSEGFSVASARKDIDSKTLVVDHHATRWNNLVPIKVNILGWRLGLNKLPTREVLMCIPSSAQFLRWEQNQ